MLQRHDQPERGTGLRTIMKLHGGKTVVCAVQGIGTCQPRPNARAERRISQPIRPWSVAFAAGVGVL